MEGLNINNMDLMAFLGSMNKMANDGKKKKKSKKCVIKESRESHDSENVAINKDIVECCEIKEENETDVSNTEEKQKKRINKFINEDKDDEEEEEDDEDDDEDEDEDDDDDDETKNLDILTNEKLYNMLNTFFVDEYGVTIATSMSNISYELHNLNKNLSKLLKSKK